MKLNAANSSFLQKWLLKNDSKYILAVITIGQGLKLLLYLLYGEYAY